MSVKLSFSVILADFLQNNPSWCRKLVTVNRRDISYLKFLLEGYDGLVTMTTVDGARGQVSLSFCAPCLPDVENILSAFKQEVTVTENPPHD